MMQTECYMCKKTDDQVRLHKCPICFKHYCEEHAVRRSGMWFCSEGCAEYFFHGEPDD
jgi:hypothetical protein